jgi:hypothetical protein
MWCTILDSKDEHITLLKAKDVPLRATKAIGGEQV